MIRRFVILLLVCFLPISLSAQYHPIGPEPLRLPAQRATHHPAVCAAVSVVGVLGVVMVIVHHKHHWRHK
jgi:hypothetical protein